MSKIRINGDLRGTPFVRVIGADGGMLGVLTLADALRTAMRAGLDLVEVNPRPDPPVCKIVDFSKYRYEERKRDAEARKADRERDDDE